MQKHLFIPAVFALSLILSACSGEGGSTPVTGPVTTTSPPPPPPPNQPTAQTPESTADIVYGSGLLSSGSKPLLLDIYQSGEPCSALRPYVILIHGGGFTMGAKDQGQLPSYAERIAEEGYVAISINYRLEGDQPVPSAEFTPLRDGLLASTSVPVTAQLELRADTISSAIEDAVTAIRWIEENDDSNCIDSSRMALWGGSAGAFIAMSVAYALDDYSINVTKPKSVIDHWGGLFETNVVEMSDPPLFIIHGDSDTVVDYGKALELQDEAEAKSLPYAFYTIAGAGHGFGEIPIETLTVNGVTLQELEIRFLNTHLRDGEANYEVVTVPKSGN